MYRIETETGPGYDLAQLPPMLDDEDDTARLACIMVAMAMTGATGEEYLGIVGPGESHQMRRDMLAMSGCGLVGRGYLRQLGFVHPKLQPPYRIGNAFDDVHNMAYNAGCLCTLPVDPSALGSIIAMGRGLNTHMAILVSTVYQSPNGTPMVWTIDGGQTDVRGNQTILYRQRAITAGKTRIRALDGRDLLWSVDPLRLQRTLGTSLSTRYAPRDTPPLPPPPMWQLPMATPLTVAEYVREAANSFRPYR